MMTQYDSAKFTVYTNMHSMRNDGQIHMMKFLLQPHFRSRHKINNYDVAAQNAVVCLF
jgi:hypothetical protein